MFVTRPTRDALTSHQKLIEAMSELAGIKWTGNRVAHKKLEEILTKKQVKGPGVSTDGSGGRTWAALARTFGYWYLNSNDKVVITPVAEAIISGDSPHLHIQKQILNYQIPNGYVLTSGFSPKYDTGYRIFPFRFLLKLLTCPELNHFLHRDEVSLFFLTAKTDADLDETINTILHYREQEQQDHLQLEQRLDLLDAVAHNFDHRKRKDSDGISFLNYLKDSALTHMIIMESVNYYWFKRSDGFIELKSEMVPQALELLMDFEARYPFNTRFQISEESFARHYGLDLSRHKNTFRYGQSVVTRKQKQDNLVKETAEEILNASPYIDNMCLVQEVQSKFPLGKEKIEQTLRRMGLFHSESMENLESRFIDAFLESATNSDYWMDHEENTLLLLNKIVSAAFRPEKKTEYIDRANVEIGVRLETSNGNVGGILDCKSGPKFHLGTRERDIMATSYIPMYKELICPDETTVPLKFFGYVIGQDFSGKSNFKMIPSKAQRYLRADQPIDGFVINARSLLAVADLFLDGLINSEDILRIFTSNIIFLDPLHIQRFLDR